MHLLDEVLFQDVSHINDFLLLGDAQVCIGHFVFMCHLLTFFLI